MKRVHSKVYLIWSVLGACLLAMASFIRGVESTEPFAAKFSLSVGYLILSSILIIYHKIKNSKTFKDPWMQKIETPS